jgi:HPt (histidine-containing phosphotransfer) domain-containing protein
MDMATEKSEYIYSRLSSDPDLHDIVDMFVEEMPSRVATLLSELNAGDWPALQRTSHQLKGAAGSYGFDAISPCAGKVEEAVKNSSPEDQIRATVDELVAMCNRVRCGVQHTGSS